MDRYPSPSCEREKYSLKMKERERGIFYIEYSSQGVWTGDSTCRPRDDKEVYLYCLEIGVVHKGKHELHRG